MSTHHHQLDASSFAALVDHTLLKATATRANVEQLCAEAIEMRTAAVCVNSFWVAAVHDLLEGSGVSTCSVVGFPLGAMSLPAVAAETSEAVGQGAGEIDMVIAVGPLRFLAYRL